MGPGASWTSSPARSAKVLSAPTSSSPACRWRCSSPAELGHGDRVASLVRLARVRAADVGAAGEVLADRGLERPGAVAVEDVDLLGALAQTAIKLLLQGMQRLVDPQAAQVENGLRGSGGPPPRPPRRPRPLPPRPPSPPAGPPPPSRGPRP